MQFLKISLFALLSAVVAADIDVNEVPMQCRAVCQQTIELSRSCDQQFNNSDTAELNCQCTAANANVFIPACEACVSTFDTDRSDNDVNDLVRSCSFTTTTFNSASTGAMTGTDAMTGTGAPTFSPTGTTQVTRTTTNAAGNTVVATSTSVQGTLVSASTTPINTPNAAANSKVETGRVGALFLGIVGVVGLL